MRKRRVGNDERQLDELVHRGKTRIRIADLFTAFPGAETEFSNLINTALKTRLLRVGDALLRVDLADNIYTEAQLAKIKAEKETLEAATATTKRGKSKYAVPPLNTQQVLFFASKATGLDLHEYESTEIELELIDYATGYGEGTAAELLILDAESLATGLFDYKVIVPLLLTQESKVRGKTDWSQIIARGWVSKAAAKTASTRRAFDAVDRTFADKAIGKTDWSFRDFTIEEYARAKTDYTVVDKPIITVTATVPDALEAEEIPGQVRFTRAASNISYPLTVKYDVLGTAVADEDYVDNLTGEVTIPAGSAYRNLWVTPIDDEISFESRSTVQIREADPVDPQTYKYGTPRSATVGVVDNNAIRNGDASIGQVGDTAQFWYSASYNGEPDRDVEIITQYLDIRRALNQPPKDIPGENYAVLYQSFPTTAGNTYRITYVFWTSLSLGVLREYQYFNTWVVRGSYANHYDISDATGIMDSSNRLSMTDIGAGKTLSPYWWRAVGDYRVSKIKNNMATVQVYPYGTNWQQDLENQGFRFGYDNRVTFDVRATSSSSTFVIQHVIGGVSGLRYLIFTEVAAFDKG